MSWSLRLTIDCQNDLLGVSGLEETSSKERVAKLENLYKEKRKLFIEKSKEADELMKDLDLIEHLLRLEKIDREAGIGDEK